MEYASFLPLHLIGWRSHSLQTPIKSEGYRKEVQRRSVAAVKRRYLLSGSPFLGVVNTDRRSYQE